MHEENANDSDTLRCLFFPSYVFSTRCYAALSWWGSKPLEYIGTHPESVCAFNNQFQKNPCSIWAHAMCYSLCLMCSQPRLVAIWLWYDSCCFGEGWPLQKWKLATMAALQLQGPSIRDIIMCLLDNSHDKPLANLLQWLWWFWRLSLFFGKLRVQLFVHGLLCDRQVILWLTSPLTQKVNVIFGQPLSSFYKEEIVQNIPYSFSHKERKSAVWIGYGSKMASCFEWPSCHHIWFVLDVWYFWSKQQMSHRIMPKPNAHGAHTKSK